MAGYYSTTRPLVPIFGQKGHIVFSNKIYISQRFAFATSTHLYVYINFLRCLREAAHYIRIHCQFRMKIFKFKMLSPRLQTKGLRGKFLKWNKTLQDGSSSYTTETIATFPQYLRSFPLFLGLSLRVTDDWHSPIQNTVNPIGIDHFYLITCDSCFCSKHHEIQLLYIESQWFFQHQFLYLVLSNSLKVIFLLSHNQWQWQEDWEMLKFLFWSTYLGRFAGFQRRIRQLNMTFLQGRQGTSPWKIKP